MIGSRRLKQLVFFYSCVSAGVSIKLQTDVKEAGFDMEAEDGLESLLPSVGGRQ